MLFQLFEKLFYLPVVFGMAKMCAWLVKKTNYIFFVLCCNVLPNEASLDSIAADKISSKVCLRLKSILWSNLHFHCIPFETTFILAEFSSPKAWRVYVNSCRIERVNVTTKLENMTNVLLPCFTNQVVSIFFKDMIVAILINSCQR